MKNLVINRTRLENDNYVYVLAYGPLWIEVTELDWKLAEPKSEVMAIVKENMVKYYSTSLKAKYELEIQQNKIQIDKLNLESQPMRNYLEGIDEQISRFVNLENTYQEIANIV